MEIEKKKMEKKKKEKKQKRFARGGARAMFHQRHPFCHDHCLGVNKERRLETGGGIEDRRLTCGNPERLSGDA